MIDEVIASFRFHFPDAPIIVMADGVWDGIKHRRTEYEEYLRLLKNRYPKTAISGFSQHSSQAKMMRQILDANLIRTQFILFNEHDIPLRTDITIEWNAIFDVLRHRRADVVRLSGFHCGVHPEHEYLAHGTEFQNGAEFRRTRQWSQWPHLATTDFYRMMMTRHFTRNELKMIEERMHGVCQNPPGAWIKLWQYIPPGADKRCFTHLSGRQGDPCHWE